MQKTQNSSGWQVIADLHYKNLAINEKLFGNLKQLLYSLLPQVVLISSIKPISSNISLSFEKIVFYCCPVTKLLVNKVCSKETCCTIRQCTVMCKV